ncbi:hypothetical protein [Paraburkholderia sp. GAS42]|uniref:hypothetical protein n=1 Tax=Paraburkholderia sp. GAS42 TaxID=3035135 RepID=UPI003D22102F
MEGHPISLDKAKELLAGDLGDVYQGILRSCCAPIYWFDLNSKDFAITHNGTLTIVQTPKKLLGVTAAHVLRQYEIDLKNGPCRVQLMNEVVDDLLERVIDVSDKLDVATFALDEDLVKRLGKTPLGVWPPMPPQEGKGIMIAGYPAVERVESKDFTVDFGLFTAIGVARTVTDMQITWLMERDFLLAKANIPAPPPEYELGGVSGGPLISWFESENFVSHHCLSGIVIEHPDYKNNKDMPPIERLIAIRADSISESGKII